MDATLSGEIVDGEEAAPVPAPRKRGRPKGSKNAPKAGAAPASAPSAPKAEKPDAPDIQIPDLTPLVEQAVVMVGRMKDDYRFQILVDEGHIARFYQTLNATLLYYGFELDEGMALIAATTTTGVVAMGRFASLPAPEKKAEAAPAAPEKPANGANA